MEIKKPKRDIYEQALYDEISRITKPIFEKAASEVPINRVSAGKLGLEQAPEAKQLYWQPHAYRLYFEFDRDLFLQQTDPEKVGFKKVNSSEYSLINWEGCTFRIKRQQIEIYNKVEHKRWYVLPLSSACRQEMQKIIMKKNQEVKAVFEKFIKTFGGASDFEIKRLEVNDNKIWGEKAINTIPIEAQFFNKVGKKVYKEPGFEFDSLMHQANYIEMQALASALPELDSKLSRIEKLTSKAQKLSKKADEKMMNVIKLQESQAKLSLATAQSLNVITKLFKSQIPEEERVKADRSPKPEYIG